MNMYVSMTKVKKCNTAKTKNIPMHSFIITPFPKGTDYSLLLCDNHFCAFIFLSHMYVCITVCMHA